MYILQYTLIHTFCFKTLGIAVRLLSTEYLHVVHKKRMVSSSRYNPDFDLVLWIPVEELIIHKYL